MVRRESLRQRKLCRVMKHRQGRTFSMNRVASTFVFLTLPVTLGVLGCAVGALVSVAVLTEDVRRLLARIGAP